MPSALAWLDYSEEDQRRAREIVALFSQQESRDELGIGTVRDALSDAMFPGVSVIQTRARYFLFIPWLFREGERRRYAGPALVAWVDRQERRLIEALRAGGATEGLIGVRAGVGVKILPSTIYWTGLGQFGILRRTGSIEQVSGGAGRVGSIEDALTELAERSAGIWHSNLPVPPEGFFKMEEASFDLEPGEAEWLAERIEERVPGTLLAWMVEQQVPLLDESDAPWTEPAVSLAPAHLQRIVRHAELFSLAIHAAALLYNRLLAERCAELGLRANVDYVEQYGEQLELVADDFESNASRLAAWDRDAFWAQVYSINNRVPPRTRNFVDRWVDIFSARGSDLLHDADARALVAARERQQKGGQARLQNDRLLRQWTGESGTRPLSFRWAQVKRHLGDIEEGRDRARA